MSEGTIAGGDAGAGGDVAAAAAAAEAAKAAAGGGAEAAKQEAGAVENKGGQGGAQEQQKGPWGDDWREKLAGTDDKKLERLKRFASPEALLQAQEEASKKISEGIKPRARPGDKATDADWEAYRKEAGIPDKVDDFVKAIPMPDGRQIGDDDKPVLTFFSEKALAKGVTPADMGIMVDAYYAMQEDQVAAAEKADADFRRESMAALKGEYGGDFDANVAAMRPYFEGVNGELFDNLMGGRMADGSKIGDHADVVRFFVAKAVAENPLATVISTNGGNAASVDTEITSLEKQMRDDYDGWFKDTKSQERYQALLKARDAVAAKK